MKKSLGYKIFLAFNTVFFCLCIIATFYPYLNVVAKAFSNSQEVAKGGITIFPRGFTLNNFRTMLDDKHMLRAFYVSVMRTVIGCVTGVGCCFMAAYAMHKKHFPGKNLFILYVMLIGYLSPGMIPKYVNYSKLGLLNNFWIYILPSFFSFYHMIVMRTFIDATIPDSLSESAYIDGAHDMQIFGRIVLPLCKPVLATVALWEMVGQWNDWTSTLYYVRNSKWHTMAYKMMQMIKESEYIAAKLKEAQMLGEEVLEELIVTPDALVSAQIILTTLPIVMVYPFLQKYFMKGYMVGSIKG